METLLRYTRLSSSIRAHVFLVHSCFPLLIRMDSVFGKNRARSRCLRFTIRFLSDCSWFYKISSCGCVYIKTINLCAGQRWTYIKHIHEHASQASSDFAYIIMNKFVYLFSRTILFNYYTKQLLIKTFNLVLMKNKLLSTLLFYVIFLFLVFLNNNCYWLNITKEKM